MATRRNKLNSCDEHPVPPEPGTIVGRVALTRQPAHIDDAQDDPSYTWKEARSLFGLS